MLLRQASTYREGLYTCLLHCRLSSSDLSHLPVRFASSDSLGEMIVRCFNSSGSTSASAPPQSSTTVTPAEEASCSSDQVRPCALSTYGTTMLVGVNCDMRDAKRCRLCQLVMLVQVCIFLLPLLPYFACQAGTTTDLSCSMISCHDSQQTTHAAFELHAIEQLVHHCPWFSHLQYAI